MSAISEIQGVLSEMVSRTVIDNIDCIRGEEKPEIIGNFLKEYLNIDQDITVTECSNFSTKYKIKIYGIDILYTICDSAGSSPDWIIYMKEGKHIFCEDTKAGLCESGNNAQFQRFTKFVPVLVDEKYHKVYYLDNNDKHEKINEEKCKGKPNKTIVAMRLWKTCGIELKTNNPLLQTNLDKFIKPYRDLKELINNWNTAACKTTNGSTKGNIWKIFNDNGIININNFVVTKPQGNGKITLANDPGIGTILLVICSCIAYGSTDFIIDNKICDREDHKYCISQNMINDKRETTMKLINSILCIQETFNVSIKINNIVLPDTPPCYNTFFNCETKSEKVVNIWEEKKLRDANKIVPFCNHARGSLEYIKICGKEYTIPNKVYTPDLIWIDIEHETIYFVEAEKYKNYNNGKKQIESWKSGTEKSITTREFFKEVFQNTHYKDYSHKAYITLYIQDITNDDINDMKYVKHILDSNRVFRTNTAVEYLDLNSSL